MKTAEPQPTDHHPVPKPNQICVSDHAWYSLSGLWHRKSTVIAAFSIVAILLHLVLRFGFNTTPEIYSFPLLATLDLGGLPHAL